MFDSSLVKQKRSVIAKAVNVACVAQSTKSDERNKQVRVKPYHAPELSRQKRAPYNLQSTNNRQWMYQHTQLKPIETIQIGDYVWAWDDAQQAHVAKRVNRLFLTPSQPTYHVNYIDSNCKSASVRGTKEHPFWVQGKGWVPLHQLQTGDALQLKNEITGHVQSVIASAINEDVFNFEVEGVHNYFVGDGGALVHNSSVIEFYLDNDLDRAFDHAFGEVDSLGERKRFYIPTSHVDVVVREGNRFSFLGVVDYDYALDRSRSNEEVKRVAWAIQFENRNSRITIETGGHGLKDGDSFHKYPRRLAVPSFTKRDFEEFVLGRNAYEERRRHNIKFGKVPTDKLLPGEFDSSFVLNRFSVIDATVDPLGAVSSSNAALVGGNNTYHIQNWCHSSNTVFDGVSSRKGKIVNWESAIYDDWVAAEIKMSPNPKVTPAIIELLEGYDPRDSRFVEHVVSTRFGRGGCFIAGTLVRTQNGTKPIEQVQVGDMVLAQPEGGGERDYRAVTQVFVYDNKPVCHVQVIDAHNRVETITATHEHPFWVQGLGWVGALNLRIGFVVQLHDGSTATVTDVNPLTTPTTVYNMTVDGFHTYYVGEMGVWVHNTSGDFLSKRAGIIAVAGIGVTVAGSAGTALMMPSRQPTAGSELNIPTLVESEMGTLTYKQMVLGKSMPVVIFGKHNNWRTSYRDRLIGAFEELNAQQKQLSIDDIRIIHLLQGITVNQDKLTSVDFKTGIFNIKPTYLFDSSPRWIASVVAHDAFHLVQRDRGIRHSKRTAHSMEQEANVFQRRVGHFLGLSPAEQNYLDADTHTHWNTDEY